eukprot:14036497-Alexandrium_andersonii.AAC.1
MADCIADALNDVLHNGASMLSFASIELAAAFHCLLTAESAATLDAMKYPQFARLGNVWPDIAT